MDRDKTNINFNFTPEQQLRFNAIYDETKKLYPQLVGDDLSKERVKVLIAYNVINPDKELPTREEIQEEIEEDNNVSLDLDKKISIGNISNGEEE